MTDTRKNIIISSLLIVIAILYTLMVKTVDLGAIGPNDSIVGFSTLNAYVVNLIGKNQMWYNITEILGLILIILAIVYAFIGFKQLIKRKSLLKVDRELLGLGGFYILVIGIYIFFEVFIVNYRPVLMDGVLEASYPSSHTLIALCLCGSGVFINNKLFKEFKFTKLINILLIVVMVLLVVGRILSGAHWCSDIIGGILISAALLMSYYTFLNYEQKK